MTSRRWTETAVGRPLSTGMARLNARHPWSHNDHFHSWILANLPEPCRRVIDVGCGRGELLATLAPHVVEVIGYDLGARMREQSARRCAGLPGVTIRSGDWSGDTDAVDVVTMIAVLHHLDVPAALRAVSRRLRPGGRFLTVGLAPPRTVGDHAWEVASMITYPIIGYVKHPWPSRVPAGPPPFPVRDPTMALGELRVHLAQVMPGAVVRHRLGFRHTIAWTKPA